jgi:hypothetical protein
MDTQNKYILLMTIASGACDLKVEHHDGRAVVRRGIYVQLIHITSQYCSNTENSRVRKVMIERSSLTSLYCTHRVATKTQ